MPIHLRVAMRVGALAAAAAVMAGCSYTVDVRNTTAQPVLVKMVQVDPIQPDWLLVSKRIGPGEYAKLGPSRVPFERVVVEVGNQTERSTPARYGISPGTTRLDVGQKPAAENGRDEVIFTLEKRSE